MKFTFKNPLSSRLLQAMFGVIVALSCLTIGALYVWNRVPSEFPVSKLKSHYPWIQLQSGDQPPKFELRKQKPPSWVSLVSIPKYVYGAIIVSEDWNFFSHKGYDAAEIKSALEQSLEAGRLKRGASTITQQLIKNVFLSHERTLSRKVAELALAIELEKSVGKAKILESYLNIVELGPGIYGLSKASWYYFEKAPSELLPREAAFLAMLLPSPKRYSQSFRQKKLTPFARKRVHDILRKLNKAGYLDADTLSENLGTPLTFEKAASEAQEVPEEDLPFDEVDEPEYDEEQETSAEIHPET